MVSTPKNLNLIGMKQIRTRIEGCWLQLFTPGELNIVHNRSLGIVAKLLWRVTPRAALCWALGRTMRYPLSVANDSWRTSTYCRTTLISVHLRAIAWKKMFTVRVLLRTFHLFDGWRTIWYLQLSRRGKSPVCCPTLLSYKSKRFKSMPASELHGIRMVF